MTRSVIMFVAAMMAITATAQKTEIIWEKDLPFYGLPPSIQVGKDQWRSKAMVYPKAFTDSDRVRSGPEFFALEYGKPCAFTQDWVKEQGYASGPYQVKDGAMVFDTGKKGFSFGFGPEPGDKTKPALRFGAGWGGQLKDNYRLRMTLEQNVPETKWQFTPGSTGGYDLDAAKAFVVKGKGPVVFEGDIGLVRCCEANPRLLFTCETPDATVKIKSVEIFPTSAEVFFRKSFEIKDSPATAHCSFRSDVVYELWVNGQKADAGTRVYPAGVLKNVDLKPYLKRGMNTIAYTRQFVNWAGGSPEFIFEGVATDKAGNLTRLLGDQSWKCSLKRQSGWEQPTFDDSAWAVPAVEKKAFETFLLKNEKVFWGLNPQPMDLLAVTPEGRERPLFEVGEPPRFLAQLPLGAKDLYSVSLDVCRGGTDSVVETLAGSNPTLGSELATYTFAPKIQEPGPYRLNWKLLDKSGKTVETQIGEMVIIGPIKQDTLALANFEAELEKRLKPVRHIDCAAAPTETDSFLDHAGMYNPPALNKGKVVKADGMNYRETGGGRWDYFAYRLRNLERGQAYLAEIVVPDNADRYIYSGVLETYPAGFCNNLPHWGRGWFNATGTCYTGLNSPLSGKTKTIRYVFFPASMNSSIVVMSGFAGHPAAACAINILKIEGGLPALELPATDRMFGEHNERMSVMTLTTGMCEQPLMHAKDIRLSPRQDAWFQLYKMYERKIQLLRFRGQNMSVEGAYMYNQGEYPSPKHATTTGGDEVDPMALMLKMYKRNGIKCLLGFEYIASPQVYVQGKDGISDRRMWQGEQGTRLVDRHGRQLVGYMNNGWNFLNPDIGAILLDCVSELSERYGKDEVAGLFLVNGAWWLPTFNTAAYPELTDLEVGYDDFTVGLFEKDSGVKLGIDSKDPQRFEKRYQALTSKYMDMWKLWRAKQTRDFVGKIAASTKWPVYSFPAIDMVKNSPFLDPKASRDERDGFFAQRCADYGRPLDLYRGKDVRLVPVVSNLGKYAGSPDESYDHIFGKNASRSVKQAIEDFSAVYVGGASGLDEVDCPASAAKSSVFEHTSRGVFIARGVEDYAMREFVDAVNVPTPPRIAFDNWHDCNMSTAFGPQLRRFATEFYATPDATFKPLDANGVDASSAKTPDGSTCLRLINNTPYPITGQFQADAKTVKDLVYGGELSSALLSGGKYKVEFKPNDIRLFRLEGLDGQIRCQFAFADDVSKSLRSDAQFILKDYALLRKVPGDLIAKLFANLESGDAFALYNTMHEFEAIAQIRAAQTARKAVGNQAKLLADLDKGRAKINCGSSSPYGDWLPDQVWKEGVPAYGNIGGNAVDRGNVDIKGTDIPRVYQTEIYGGQVNYRIPLPDGAYTVRLHFAETFVGNTQPGARLISVAVEGKTLPERIDPLKLAGGWGMPYVLELKDVQVFDKSLDLELTGSVELNGVEIEKAK